MTLEAGYQKWLSLGFLRSPSVMRTLNRLELSNFKPNEKSLMVLFKIGKEWYEANKTPVPALYIAQIAQTELLPKGIIDEREFENLHELLEFCYQSFTDPINTVEQYIQNIISSFIEDRQLRTLAESLKSSQNLGSVVDQINTVVSKTSVSKITAIDPMAGELPIVSGEKKRRWNCDFLDSITGGAVRGETTLFLAPSGGGKTLSNIQIACSSILHNEDPNECALIFSYEQAVIPGLTNRVNSYMLGKRIDFFQGLDEKEMKAAIEADSSLKALWRSKKEKTQGRLLMYDMLEMMQKYGCNGILDIENAIKDCLDSGKKPRYVGLDWFGPFITGYMNSDEVRKKGSNRAKYTVMAEAADDLRKMGMNLGINLFIFHQLGTHISSKRPIDLPDAGDSYECKSLHQWMDTVICIGNRTKSNNLAYVSVPKHRNGEAHIKACIQMDGAFSRWKYISDRVIDDGNGGLLIPGSYGSTDLSAYADDDEPNGGNTKEAKVKQLINSVGSEYLM